MRENTRSFQIFFYEFNSFASELSHATDVVVLSETRFSADTCHDVQGYNGFHSYRADKTGGGVSVFIRIVTHRPKRPIFQCVIHIMRSVW